MKAIAHEVKHYYQPTNTSCSPTALTILLSFYGFTTTPETIMESVPQLKNEQGENSGTINQQLATWSIVQGFGVSIYSFDCQILDLTWADRSPEKVIERLEAAKDGWVVPSLGQAWSNAYRQSYIDFLEAGGALHIEPSVSTKLLYKLLQDGPVLPCLCDNTLYGSGKTLHNGLQETKLDDINGKTTNHSVVIYGNDAEGNFLVADPWYKPDRHVIEPERLLCAISTAQIECDNLLFQLVKK